MKGEDGPLAAAETRLAVEVLDPRFTMSSGRRVVSMTGGDPVSKRSSAATVAVSCRERVRALVDRIDGDNGRVEVDIERLEP